MFIAVEPLDDVAYAHAIDAKLFQENDEMGLPQDQTSLTDFSQGRSINGAYRER